jgi:hypothetical protein
MTNNVIQFPKTRAANKNVRQKLEAMQLSRVHYESLASEAMDAIAQVLATNGYHPLKEKDMLRDMGVIMNMLVAMMYRVDGEIHFLQEPMDEIHDVLKYVKELNDKKMNELFTDDD